MGYARELILLVGLVAGWLAGKIVTGGGFGLIGDMAIGIVGALIGSWLMPQLGVHIANGIVSAIIVATIGAVLLYVALGVYSLTGSPKRSLIGQGLMAASNSSAHGCVNDAVLGALLGWLAMMRKIARGVNQRKV